MLDPLKSYLFYGGSKDLRPFVTLSYSGITDPFVMFAVVFSVAKIEEPVNPFSIVVSVLRLNRLFEISIGDIFWSIVLK